MRIINILPIVMLLITGSVFAADNIADAFKEGSLKGEIKTYYFSRDFDEDTQDRADFAVGTTLFYKTAPLYGVSAGLAFATSNNILIDDDKAVYGLVKHDEHGKHESFSRLQQYFIQGDWFKTTIKYGAQEINTPFMNTHPIRMVSKTYHGLSVVNRSIEGLELSGYYITKYMGWWDEEFISVTESVNSSASEDDALIVGGIKYTLPVESVKAVVEGWEYYLNDVFQSTYLKANIAKKIGDYGLHFTPSYLVQKSKGDDLGGEFDTKQYGFNTGVSAYGASLTAFYANTPDDAVFAPWGDGKVVIQQINASGRAEEDTYALKLDYDFGAIGAKGLSAYVFHAIYDTPESLSPDINETDFSVQYNFSGALKGLSTRVRYAMIDVEDGEDYNDFRVYVKYTFTLQGK